MTDRRKILVISPLIAVNAPQPSRFRELVRNWSSHYNISVLTFKTSLPPVFIGDDNIIVNEMDFTVAGRFFISSRLKDRGMTGSAPVSAATGRRFTIRKLFKKARINRWFFPDIFIVEYRNIKKHLLNLVELTRPETVIISTAPFTLMLLTGVLKKRYPWLKVIIDTGDPFYGDSSDYSHTLFHRLFSKSVEKSCLLHTDLLVVPTITLRNFYISVYKDIIPGNRVSVIENGICEIFTKITPRELKDKKHCTAVYAGRFYKELRDPSELFRAVQMFPANRLTLKIFGGTGDMFIPPVDDERFIKGGTISVEELAAEYDKADILILLDNAYGVQVPGKIWEVLAVPRPVLYIYKDENSPSYNIVKEMEGVVMTRNDQKDIADAIAHIISGKAGYPCRRESVNYTFESLAVRYRSLLDAI